MSIRINGLEITSFRQQLQNVPKEFRKELRPRLRRAAAKVVQQVQANASWSSRIPAATSARVSFIGSGITVKVDRNAAPHARPIEFGSARQRASINRHPVFGHDVWVNQPTRPFFLKAIASTEKEVVAEVQAAIESVFARL